MRIEKGSAGESSSILNPQSSIRDASRVVITGIGIVSPFGRGRAANLDALREGRSGIKTITSINADNLACKIAGEVPGDAHEGLHKGHDRFTRFALIAAEEALEQAGDLRLEPQRIGTLIGTGLGGCETLDGAYRRLYADNSRVPPMSIPMSMYNAAASAVATKFNARGLSYAIVSACASSAHAIGLATQAIASGQADAVIAGGADAPITTGIVKAWESLRVLAIDNEHPAAACRPFSADRKGLVLAEGAAVLILESEENAKKRGAPILGEIKGFGATSDAGHITDPSADGAARAMGMALQQARWTTVDYINAHGTGTRANDVTETNAIKTVFKDAPPISSTKSLHGHAMGASGAIEIVCSMLALGDGFLPPTLNLENADPACDLDYVPNEPRETRATTFLSNSFGFGGMNAAVAIHLLTA